MYFTYETTMAPFYVTAISFFMDMRRWVRMFTKNNLSDGQNQKCFGNIKRAVAAV